MAAVDDLYHRRLLGANPIIWMANRLLTRNAGQEPASRYKQLLIVVVKAQIRGGSSVSHRCMFGMTCDYSTTGLDSDSEAS